MKFVRRSRMTERFSAAARLAPKLIATFGRKWVIGLGVGVIIATGVGFLVLATQVESQQHAVEFFLIASAAVAGVATWVSVVTPAFVDQQFNKPESVPLVLTDQDGELATASAIGSLGIGFAVFLVPQILLCLSGVWTGWPPGQVIASNLLPLLPVATVCAYRQTQSLLPPRFQPVWGMFIGFGIVFAQLAATGLLAKIPLIAPVIAILQPAIDAAVFYAVEFGKLLTAYRFYAEPNRAVAWGELWPSLLLYAGLLAASPIFRGPRRKVSPMLLDYTPPQSIREWLGLGRTTRPSRPLPPAAHRDPFASRLKRDRSLHGSSVVDAFVHVAVPAVIGFGVTLMLALIRASGNTAVVEIEKFDVAMGAMIAVVVACLMSWVDAAQTIIRGVGGEQRDDKIQLLTLAGIEPETVFWTALKQPTVRLLAPCGFVAFCIGLFAYTGTDTPIGQSLLWALVAAAGYAAVAAYIGWAAAIESAMTQTSIVRETIGVLLATLPPLYLIASYWRYGTAISNLTQAAAGTLQRRV